jgi:hypothetical protein
MAQPTYWEFSFQFVRIGQTNLWELNQGALTQPSAGAESGLGASLGLHDERFEWVDVRLESTELSDVDELEDATVSLAIANFRKRHPDADLKE